MRSVRRRAYRVRILDEVRRRDPLLAAKLSVWEPTHDLRLSPFPPLPMKLPAWCVLFAFRNTGPDYNPPREPVFVPASGSGGEVQPRRGGQRRGAVRGRRGRKG
jgi:hypothetical protein